MIKTLKGRRTSLLTLVILAVALVITFSYMATASAQGAEPTTVTLISDSVIEIEYATPVTSDEQAKELWSVCGAWRRGQRQIDRATGSGRTPHPAS